MAEPSVMRMLDKKFAKKHTILELKSNLMGHYISGGKGWHRLCKRNTRSRQMGG